MTRMSRQRIAEIVGQIIAELERAQSGCGPAPARSAHRRAALDLFDTLPEGALSRIPEWMQDRLTILA